MTRTSQSHDFMSLKLFFRGVEFETLDKANPDGLEFSFCLWWLNSKQLDSCKRFWSYFWLNLNAFMEFTIVLCVCSVVSSPCCVCVRRHLRVTTNRCSLWRLGSTQTGWLPVCFLWRTGNVVLLTPRYAERCPHPRIHLQHLLVSRGRKGDAHIPPWHGAFTAFSTFMQICAQAETQRSAARSSRRTRGGFVAVYGKAC